jgi:hypothetical protein
LKHLKAENEEAQQVAINAFLMLFADWLAARADEERPHDDEADDELNDARGRRVKQLARLITTTPAPTKWAIWQKLEILEHYLIANGDGTSWTDNREFVMLAGIKADLATFDYETIRRGDFRRNAATAAVSLASARTLLVRSRMADDSEPGSSGRFRI